MTEKSFKSIGIPEYTRLANCTVDEIHVQTMIIQMDDPSNYVEIDNLAAELEAVFRRQDRDALVTIVHDSVNT